MGLEQFVNSDFVLGTAIFIGGLLAKSIFDYLKTRADARNMQIESEAKAEVEKAKARAILTETDIKGEEARAALVLKMAGQIEQLNTLAIRQQNVIFDMGQREDQRWREYQATFEVQRKGLAEQHVKINNLETGLEKSKEANAQTQKELEEAKLRVTALETQLEDEKKARELLATELAEEQDKRLDLEKALAERDAKIKELTEQLEAARERLRLLEAQQQTSGEAITPEIQTPEGSEPTPG